MLGFRAKLNSDPELVKLISTRFIPVAVDHEIERRRDAEGELYRKVAGKSVSNSVFAFDPSGKLLFQRLGGEIYQKYNSALAAAIKDYEPAKADVKSVPTGSDRDEHFYPVPEGAVVVHVTSRMVKGVPQADGKMAVEARMDVNHVAEAVRYMASLPLASNVLFMTVMATQMPFVGRG